MKPVFQPGEDWGEHGFSPPFLSSSVTCALVSFLRKQLRPYFALAGTAPVKYRSYEEITTQLTLLQNELQVKISHCLRVSLLLRDDGSTGSLLQSK